MKTLSIAILLTFYSPVVFSSVPEADLQSSSLHSSYQLSFDAGEKIRINQLDDIYIIKKNADQININQTSTLENETEYWPTIIGYKIKVTDTITIFINLLFVLFTALLWMSTKSLWISSEKQISLAKDTLVATQRPKIRVRNIVLSDSCDLSRPNETIHGQFYVSNVGGTSASITESHCLVYCSRNGLPMRRPYEGQNGNCPLGSITLAPGESYPGFFDHFEPLTIQPDPSKRIIGGGMLYVMGWIEYIDDRNVKRRTAFCREYRLPANESFHSARFFPVDDLDYEHEE